MTNLRVEELLQEFHNCKATTKEDFNTIKELYESEICFTIVDGKVYDEAGTWVADVEYYN